MSSKIFRPTPPNPLPLATLVNHPLALAMPASAFGALMRLGLHFHQTDCRPLPTATQAIMAISRASWPIWKQHQADIHAVLADWMPEIEEYRRRRLIGRERLRIAARKGNLVRKLAARSEAPERTMPAVEKVKRPASGQALAETRMWDD